MKTKLLLWLSLAALWAGTLSTPAFTLLSSNQLVFVNVDHAPMGACSTITYGFQGPVGFYTNDTGAECGLGMSSALIPFRHAIGGVVIALSGSGGLQSLPFVLSPASVSSNASYFDDADVHRTLTPCTDQWTIDNAGFAFTHYSPAWLMASLDTASLADQKRFFLPATWLVFTVDNTNTTPEDLYFGLPTAATQTSFANGAYQGFVVSEAALAVQSGSCDLLSGPSLTAALNGMTQGFAFHLRIPPGQTGTLTVVIAYYRSAVVDSRISGYYYYTSLFGSVDEVIDSAFAEFADARMRCQQLASAMANAGLNPYRQFLASHAMHSYMANTACLIEPGGGVGWRVTEGAYQYINTCDLVVDMAFYDCQMHPWALRNVLDTFSGAINGPGYSFNDPLYSSTSGAPVGDGFSFDHDMGGWPTSGTGPAYGGTMGQEELHTWILSAGLYWSRTADNAWLTNNLTLLQTCLNSMLLRDDTNAASRNGITKNVNAGEITTFDDLDASLQAPAYSGRLAVRNWAAYLALQAMFGQVGDTTDAATCQNMAAVAAQTIAGLWTNYQGTLGYIPALLDGSDQAATIPMVEGLAFPLQMGLTNAVDRSGGPYAPMLLALSNHLAAVLVRGKCLDATSGAWDMTSATGYQNCPNTWQSKMYIAQYVAEHVLGLSGNNVNGTVDQIHATIQIQNAPFHEWSDQTDGTGADRFLGGCHYPRGITSALWWLNATNNTAPLPSILTPPLTQTAEMGSLAGFWVEVTNIPPAATYQWYFNGTNGIGVTTNPYLDLANVQPAQAGAYTVVVTNLAGAATSAPALLSVIPPVERTIVPAVGLTGGTGSLLHLEYADSLAPPAAPWSSLTNVTLGVGPQLCFDLSQPSPPQRFYRAWQTNGPQPALDMSQATEIPLSGTVGSSVRIDYINRFGPTNAWVTLDTVVLTNTTQAYFDVTMFRQPTRLYRLVPVP